MEPIVSLIYCSEVREQLGNGGEAVADLLSEAREKNEANGISGVICFNREYVVQCIEGGRTAINTLYGKLVVDPRHARVTLLDYRYVARRTFRTWAMGYIPACEVGRELNLMYSAREVFDPFQFSGEGAYLVVQEVGAMATDATEEG